MAGVAAIAEGAAMRVAWEAGSREELAESTAVALAELDGYTEVKAVAE